MKGFVISFFCFLALIQITYAQTQTTAPPINKMADRFSPVDPGAVRIGGFLGERCKKNESARLLTKNEDEMLSGFRNRPGKQAWEGEHAGKWLHAATLAWAYTKSEALRAKLDRVASALIAAQQPDGYLARTPARRIGE